MAKLARKNDVKRLAAALDYRDYVVDHEDRLYDLGAQIRRDAALALMSLSNTNGVDVGPALIRSLGDSSGEVREAAADALGARREARAVFALAEAALSWEDPRYAAARAAAADALIDMSGPEAIEAVVKTVIERPFDAQRAERLVSGIAEHGSEGTARRACDVAATALSMSAGPRAERASDLLVWLGSESVEPLLRLLAKPGDARIAAIAALGRIGDLRASPALVRLLSDDDTAVRRAVATALGKLADPTAVQPLVHATRDPDLTVRYAALESLRRLSPLTAISSSDRFEAAPGSQVRPEDRRARRGTRSSWFRG